MIKKLLLTITLFSTGLLMAQKSLNDYKYVIVPDQFEFLKKPDQYQTSSLTKFLFKKEGFKALLSNEAYPTDLINNTCSALTAHISNTSGFLTTKVILTLKDCHNTTVFTTKEGKSKIKDFKKSYHEAIRNAFKSIVSLNYKYTEKNNSLKATTKNNQEINKNSTVKTLPKTIKNNTPTVVENKNSIQTLYAQPIANGYQLVNTKPEIIFQVIKTNLKDVYIIKDKNGILYKNGNIWISEILNEEVKQYQIKF